jgi:hypothetical protein
MTACPPPPSSILLFCPSDTAGSKADVLSVSDLSLLLTVLVLDFDYLPVDQERRQALVALLAPRILDLHGVLLVDVLDALGRQDLYLNTACKAVMMSCIKQGLVVSHVCFRSAVQPFIVY